MKALESLGFVAVRVGNHVMMAKQNADGTETPLTLPNHRTLKGSTLRHILTESEISRDDFLQAYENA